MLKLEEFLGLQVDGASSTQVVLVPEGEYLAQIEPDGIGLADFTYTKGEREGQKGYRMTVKWRCLDENGDVEKQIGRPPVLTQSIMLDLTDEGGLDMSEGRNVSLGRLRDAVNQNENGKPWQPAMLIGQMAKILVKHSINQKTGDPMQEVNRVGPATS